MIVPVGGQPPVERIVVVSPHFDDGVLSLGASVAAWRRAGHPSASSRSSAATQTREPRREAGTGAGASDGGRISPRPPRGGSLACAVLGATPLPLAFGSVDYERGGDERAVREPWRRARHRELVLLPGRRSPIRITNGSRGHSWRRWPPVGLYAEQPYTLRSGRAPQVPDWLAAAVGGNLVPFEPVAVGPRDRLAKWRSVRRYGARSCPCSGCNAASGPARTATRSSRSRWPSTPAEPRPTHNPAGRRFGCTARRGTLARWTPSGCPWRRRRPRRQAQGRRALGSPRVRAAAAAGGAVGDGRRRGDRLRRARAACRHAVPEPGRAPVHARRAGARRRRVAEPPGYAYGFGPVYPSS